ncbi:hypothetical protein AGMMS49992_20500 [Clostridia bacterium]|nr:hypothetical protein AGMMS49992_20500 [Clostridia bacterium]
MAKGTDYWRERAEQTSDRAYADEQATMDKISRAYKAGTQNITESVESIIYNYAKRYKMTEAEAKAAISAPISYEEYLALLPQIRALPAFGEEYMRLAQRAATRAANFRITRLESLQDNMRAQLSRVAAAQETATTDYLKNVFGISADEAAQEMWERLGAAGVRLDSQTLHQILAEPWSGKNYSARIWDNAAQLQSTLESVMTSGLLNGDSVDDMARRIAEEMGVGLANARRLVRTEATYVHNQTTLESYRRAGLTQYEYMTAKDERVCDVCGPLDGQRFNISEAYPGVNCPPMHPNCRCTTLAVVDSVASAAMAEKEAHAAVLAKMIDDVFMMPINTAVNTANKSSKINVQLATIYEFARLNGMVDELTNMYETGAAIESGAKKTDGWEDRFADQYYEAIRNRKPYSDAKNIALHTYFTDEQIEAIRLHVFVNEHELDGGTKRFASDPEQAWTWKRLIEGKEIRPSDIVFLQHELAELTLMREKGYTYSQAHEIVNLTYDWWSMVRKD